VDHPVKMGSGHRQVGRLDKHDVIYDKLLVTELKIEREKLKIAVKKSKFLDLFWHNDFEFRVVLWILRIILQFCVLSFYFLSSFLILYEKANFISHFVIRHLLLFRRLG